MSTNDQEEYHVTLPKMNGSNADHDGSTALGETCDSPRHSSNSALYMVLGLACMLQNLKSSDVFGVNLPC